MIILINSNTKYIILWFLIFIQLVFNMKPILNAKSQNLNNIHKSGASSDHKIDSGAVKILFLGDSYTIGTGVSLEKSWPLQLEKSLVSSGFFLKPSKIIAGNGWSTKELVDQFLYLSPENNFDMATIQIGVNDQFRNRDKISYKFDFEKLAQLTLGAVDNKPDRVVVLSIPDYSRTPSGKELDPKKISKEIDDYNHINKEIAKHKGFEYIDITSLSRVSSDNIDLVAPDGLHFSERMYSKWVELILPVFLEKLKK